MTGVSVPAGEHLSFDLPVGRLSAAQQWWVLTVRGLTQVLRNGEFLFAFLSPAMFAVCFFVPLRKVMDTLGVDYAQFLMPIIMLQSMSFVASSAAMRSSLDGHFGVSERFRVMPMPALVPASARMVTNLVLLGVALVCGLIACVLLGWRPSAVDQGGGGWSGALLAVVIVGAVGLVLAAVADAIGLVSSSPAMTSQVLYFPTLILGMLSNGFVPTERFPEWIRGFVRNQPISQFVASIRLAQDGALTWHAFWPSLCWLAGLLVLAGVLFTIAVRRGR
ncbi:ABC transporter permease [Gordonia sp. VNK21]|uniref:ABC transporter permease n=1 Tax=Gordonia sp. VNK21 TaxID=3382483 RepID=UPI0038D44633